MKLVFATHNAHKFKEVSALMPPTIDLHSLPMIGCHEAIEETGTTLLENALIKANYVTDTYGYPCFADDTGLLVEVLNGAPGVYSARYAGDHGDSQANMAKLLHKLGESKNRNARFETVIVLNMNGIKHEFLGRVKGSISQQKQGDHGFGYDPIFKPDGYDKTFAQLPLGIKNKIGHRGKAIQKLISFLSTI